MSKKSKSAKCPIPKRIRRRLQVTLDPDIYDRIKNSGVNASRLIDKAVSALFSHVDPVYLLVSSKEAQKGVGPMRFERTTSRLSAGLMDEETTGIEKRGDIHGDFDLGVTSTDDTALYGKTATGEQFFILNLDDAVDYVKHGLKRIKPVEPLSKDDRTGKGVMTAVKQFLEFGDVISESRAGEHDRAEILERTARITYKSVRAYNNAQNAKKGGKTDTGYVKRFLEYLARSRGATALQEWADTLEYRYSGIEEKALYAQPGEKGYVTVDDAIQDLKTYYQETLGGKTQPQRLAAYRQLVTAIWALSTGMRPVEISKVKWDHLKTAVRQGYFEAPAIMTKTGEGRVIPLHPQVKPHISLLIEMSEKYPRNLPMPFHNKKFGEKAGEIGANLVLAQYRNLAVMEWRNHGVDPIIRLAVMGHDQMLVKQALQTSGLSADEQTRILTQEQEAAGEMTQTYGKLQPPGIAAGYHRTVGKWKFIPTEIDIKKIKPLLEPKVRRTKKKSKKAKKK